MVARFDSVRGHCVLVDAEEDTAVAHMKVMAGGGCFGRVAIENGDEETARRAAAKIIEMHTNHKGDKGASSPSSSAHYAIERDEANYPLG